MQVKTYSGPTSKAVLDQIKAELGLDAVILESRTGKENGKQVVRMTAALERPEPHATPEGFSAGTTGGRGARAYAQADPLSAFAGTANIPGGRDSAAPWQTPGGAARWQEEWAGIKKHIFALMKPAMKLELLTPQQRLSLEYLQREGVGDPVLLDFYEELVSDPARTILEPMNRLAPVRPWGQEHWRQRVHLITGPYGAGKTTMAVRMAMHLQKHSPNSRFCLVNADAERGSGRLLLKHYAGLSDFPYREASSPLDMAGAISEIRSQGFDRVLIDLPALSKDKTLPGLLSSLGLNPGGYDAMAAHLVLPPHYDQAALAALLPRYSIDMESSLVWSKLDEAETYGALLNIAALTRLPVSALSFGPGLRGTMVPAQSALLWRMLFKHALPA